MTDLILKSFNGDATDVGDMTVGREYIAGHHY